MKTTHFLKTLCTLFVSIYLMFCVCATTTAKPALLTNIEKVLIMKDVQKLNQYADILKKSEKNVNVFWYYFREIVPGFNEGVFYVKKYTSKKGHHNVVNELAYRVSIVTFDSAIIYYKLGEVITDYEGDGKETYVHKKTYKNDTAFVLLCNTFKSMFNMPLNMNELFVEGFTYGRQCGIGGVNPKPRQQMEEFVTNNNKDSLIKWLQSTNTEKQIYAVEGLLELEKHNAQLSKEERVMIDMVLGKKGDLNYCVGCTHTSIKINEITRILNNKSN